MPPGPEGGCSMAPVAKKGRRGRERGTAALLGLTVALLPGALSAADGDPSAPAEAADADVVRPGAVVQLEYTLRSLEGELLDSTRGRPPLVFTVGSGEV